MANNQAISHKKEDLMNLFPDWFPAWGKFQGEPYHTEVNLKCSTQENTL